MKKHKEVLAMIKAIRGSFHDSSIVYKFGGCYGLYEILKVFEPKAIAYFSDKDEDHIIIKIGLRFYHIDGEYPFLHTRRGEEKKLTLANHEYWEACASGQRIELIVAKFNSRCAEISKSE